MLSELAFLLDTFETKENVSKLLSIGNQLYRVQIAYFQHQSSETSSPLFLQRDLERFTIDKLKHTHSQPNQPERVIAISSFQYTVVIVALK